MGRYVNQPLTVTCVALTEVRRFLTECQPVSDQEQFFADSSCYLVEPQLSLLGCVPASTEHAPLASPVLGIME